MAIRNFCGDGMNWSILLDIAAALLLLGLFAAGVYEMLAILNNIAPFTPNLPYITDIVRPWIATHRNLALLIAALVVAALFWLFFHFFGA